MCEELKIYFENILKVNPVYIAKALVKVLDVIQILSHARLSPMAKHVTLVKLLSPSL